MRKAKIGAKSEHFCHLPRYRSTAPIIRAAKDSGVTYFFHLVGYFPDKIALQKICCTGFAKKGRNSFTNGHEALMRFSWKFLGQCRLHTLQEDKALQIRSQLQGEEGQARQDQLVGNHC